MQKKIGFFSIDITTYGLYRRIKLREEIGIELAGSAAAIMLILFPKLHFFLIVSFLDFMLDER
jgi:hypothetical protein